MKKPFWPDQPQIVQPAEQETRKDYIKKLREFIEGRAKAYRDENIPITIIGDDGRIDPNPPSEAERWGRKIAKDAKKIETPIPTETEQLGMLSFAIFAKNFPQSEFVVARSSRHDNPKNDGSTLILERETGNLVCAFSEVSGKDTDEYQYETGEKALSVNKLNLNGGASLDHGIIKNKDGVIVISRISNVPVFYLALPPHYLYEGLKHFLPGMEQSSQEKKLYELFIARIYAQIKSLNIEKGELDENLERRLSRFEKIILSEINREDLPDIKKLIK